MYNFEDGTYISEWCNHAHLSTYYSRFQVAYPIAEKQNQTDQSNASNTKMSPSTVKAIDQLHASTNVPQRVSLLTCS